MKNINYKYKKTESFNYFNKEINDNIVFYDDITGRNALYSNKYIRYIIYKEILKENLFDQHIFYYNHLTPKNILFELNKNKHYKNIIENCLGKNFPFNIIRVENEILILSPIGNNLMQLIFSSFKKYHLISVLYTYLSFNESLYIDVTKYCKMFSFTLKHHLFQLKDYKKDLDVDNIFIKEHLLSNWVEKPINKKNLLFYFNNDYFLKNTNKNFKKSNYQNQQDTNCFLFIKDKPSLKNLDYSSVDLISFHKATKKVNNFNNFSVRKELCNISTFNGYCIAIKENNQIIAGACLEKIGVNYVYVSYIFTIDEKQRQGYGTKILEAIENECAKLNKKIMIICYNPLAMKLYKKLGYEQRNEMYCPDLNSK